MRKLAVLLLSPTALGLATCADAQTNHEQGQSLTSLEYAQMGRRSWAAFECAAYASFAKDAAEQERLFRLGYREGLAFIGVLGAEKINEDDVRSTIPILVTMRLSGPSADFALGTIWEATAEFVGDEVNQRTPLTNDGTAPSAEEKLVIAKRGFRERNCSSLR